MHPRDVDKDLDNQVGFLLGEIRRVFRFGFLTFYMDRTELRFKWTVTRKGTKTYFRETSFYLIDLKLGTGQSIPLQVITLFDRWFEDLPEILKRPKDTGYTHTPSSEVTKG